LRLDRDAILGFPGQVAGAGYKGPAMFIHGALSDYVRPEHRSTITALFPAARLCEVADAGHWVHADQPAGFLDCLQALLAVRPG
jgi:pimeloyl-ACP methyl ester carboxylesterase